MRECRAYDPLHSSIHISSHQTLVDDSNFMDRDMDMDWHGNGYGFGYGSFTCSICIAQHNRRIIIYTSYKYDVVYQCNTYHYYNTIVPSLNDHNLAGCMFLSWRERS